MTRLGFGGARADLLAQALASPGSSLYWNGTDGKPRRQNKLQYVSKMSLGGGHNFSLKARRGLLLEDCLFDERAVGISIGLKRPILALVLLLIPCITVSNLQFTPTGYPSLPINFSSFHIHLHYCPLCMTCCCSESDSPVVWLDVSCGCEEIKCVLWGEKVRLWEGLNSCMERALITYIA